ncbi:MAG: HAD-IC family P-type ATPase [Chloroflexus sp.]|jgi:Ca2+-transporting ATPase|nr:HAD-IC family P-type ATPase [Chloroflexus sp.]
MQPLLSKHWHHLPIKEVIELLETDPEIGLDVFEIKRRQTLWGSNTLTPRHRKSPIIRFLLQFHSPLIYILLVATIITAILGEIVDAIIILAVVLINAIIGYIQESRAERAIEMLAQAMTTEATVIRSGKIQRIPAAELTLGDVVLLKAGDKVPADLRLIRSRDLQIAEAPLTGESVPVQKDASIRVDQDTMLTDRHNMAYASTLVTYGSGVGIVVAIGDNTEVGRISQLISTAEELQTPLTRKIAQFSRLLLFVILSLAAVTFAIGVGRGQPIVDTFIAAIAIAVAMIPEGLPAALTVTLAIGVWRMAQRRAIIRKLPAVETLGSVTIICSDKTGTLTQNQMTVQQIYVTGATYRLSGTGYAPFGEIWHNDEKVTTLDGHAALAETLRAGLLCNDSVLVEKDGVWSAEGDPTEVALIVAARKAGITATELPRIDTIPFESKHQYMATMHDAGPQQERIIFVKGAAETILARCTWALDNTGNQIPLNIESVQCQVNAMACEGLRVLAFAKTRLPATTMTLRHEDIRSDLVFLGLQGMIDPPRPEAIAAVDACQTAGIQVKMITGDHALTAAAIAHTLGLGRNTHNPNGLPKVITGAELANCSDEELIRRIEEIDVFARVSPEQKLRLVYAYQSRNHIVAMTGDGVNDAPALKQADIGVAMGITGTEVAKEAADMVLTDDNFATIAAAVEEGRGVFDNLTKIITWTLPTNLGEGLIVLWGIILGTTLPVLPVQVLWINTTTAVALGIVLAMEKREPDIMRRPPRRPDAPILTNVLIRQIVMVSLIILVGAISLFELELRSGASLAAARTVAVNTVIMVEIFFLLNCRSLIYSMFQIGVFSNRWVLIGISIMIALQLLYTYVPFMNTIMHSSPIDAAAWMRIIGVGFVGYLLVEMEKWLRRRRRERTA